MCTSGTIANSQRAPTEIRKNAATAKIKDLTEQVILSDTYNNFLLNASLTFYPMMTIFKFPKIFKMYRDQFLIFKLMSKWFPRSFCGKGRHG